jgi:hypothetical protein
LTLSDSVIEVDEPGLLSFIENGRRAGDPQSSGNGFLAPSLFVHEQDIGMHLYRWRDRPALVWIELSRNEAAIRIHDFHPPWQVSSPVLDRFRRK